MNSKEFFFRLIDRLAADETISRDDLRALLRCDDQSVCEYLAVTADKVRKKTYKNHIYIRGLIEFTNYCSNDCYYCGIRCSNKKTARYRLTGEEILDCCEKGYVLGFRTFVLQGGEDPYWNDSRLEVLISEIKERYTDCALTLSIGERSMESYARLRSAGADRFLLRHETADSDHYSKLHPAEMSHENRLKCLNNLKTLGFQTGCGFMVGSPYQTMENILDDLYFIKEFGPEMVGIGPFIPASDTPFASMTQGSYQLTLKLISIIRLMNPKVLLPATTALSTASEEGRALGIKAGANVVMPNLSPDSVRSKYNIYDNKASAGCEAAEALENLCRSMEQIGYTVVKDIGNYPTEV